MADRQEWLEMFDERQQQEIKLCRLYADEFRHGTDGHNIRLIVARLSRMVEAAEAAGVDVKRVFLSSALSSEPKK